MKWLINLLAQAESALAIARGSGALVVLSYVGLAIYAVVFKHQTFDMQSFGIGAGAVITAMGAAERLSLRSSSTGASS